MAPRELETKAAAIGTEPVFAAIEDKKQLNGYVAGVFERKSLAGAELVDWLHQLVPETSPIARRGELS